MPVGLGLGLGLWLDEGCPLLNFIQYPLRVYWMQGMYLMPNSYIWQEGMKARYPLCFCSRCPKAYRQVGEDP